MSDAASERDGAQTSGDGGRPRDKRTAEAGADPGTEAVDVPLPFDPESLDDETESVIENERELRDERGPGAG